VSELASGPLLVGLLPALVFLGALLYFDSYQLVPLRAVLLTICVGGLCAGLAWLVNRQIESSFAISHSALSRYVAPLVEEFLKALVPVLLLRTHRIGFLVDAAIFGFAVGTGFALVENAYLLQVESRTNMVVWIVRGFGTAIMHGGCTALFAVIAAALSETRVHVAARDLLPGLLLAVLTHSLYNHFFLSPLLSTALILIVLPVVGYVVIRHSEEAVSRWLDIGFDADTRLLEILHSGEFSSSRIGRYLTSLREHFPGEVVVDMLCYLRLHKELALRAKGMLLMRENGFDVEPDQDVRETLLEMKQLQRNIGKTGQAAIRPFLKLSRKDLWQIYMLDS
jgi:RsiW-degrading membrane proteinase PrsW (M82 family)